MYDSGKIITGLVIALVLLTFPVWYNLVSAGGPAPDPKLSAKAQAAKECVRPKADMKVSHMQVLDDWRTAVVRDHKRFFIPVKDKPGTFEMDVIQTALKEKAERTDQVGLGRQMERSLQNNCMNCHDNKKDFCDQCHNYMSVTPFCWDCHVEPEVKK
ncbi:MAG: hypothetical protein AB1641_03520 [Thermodesulfobacteriota bacterium]